MIPIGLLIAISVMMGVCLVLCIIGIIYECRPLRFKGRLIIRFEVKEELYYYDYKRKIFRSI